MTRLNQDNLGEFARQDLAIKACKQSLPSTIPAAGDLAKVEGSPGQNNGRLDAETTTAMPNRSITLGSSAEVTSSTAASSPSSTNTTPSDSESTVVGTEAEAADWALPKVSGHPEC